MAAPAQGPGKGQVRGLCSSQFSFLKVFREKKLLDFSELVSQQI